MLTLVKFIRRVPKPLTCSFAVTAQKAISPKPCLWKGRYVIPPTTFRFRRTIATERCRLSSTSRAIYSRGMLGSCLEKMFFSAINLQMNQFVCWVIKTLVNSVLHGMNVHLHVRVARSDLVWLVLVAHRSQDAPPVLTGKLSNSNKPHDLKGMPEELTRCCCAAAHH